MINILWCKLYNLLTYSWDNGVCCQLFRANYTIIVSSNSSAESPTIHFLHLHPRSRTSVIRVIRSYQITPLLCRLGSLSIRAAITPSRWILGSCRASDIKASVWHTRVDGSSLKYIGVGSNHYVCHHGARAGSGDECPVCVAAVVGHCVGDHVSDGLAVAAAVVG